MLSLGEERHTNLCRHIPPNKEQEEMCDVTPLGIPLPTKEGSLSLKVGVTVGCSAVTVFWHLF